MLLNKHYYSFSLLKQSVSKWWADDPFTQSAAVAYYTIFSFPALVILYFSFASIFMEEANLQQQVFGFLHESFGQNAAKSFQNIIQNSAPKATDLSALFLAGSVLLFAALRLFLQLQKALNHIWQIDRASLTGIKALIVRRLLSFAVMIAVLFTLSVSLLLTSLMSTMTSWLLTRLPDIFVVLAHVINLSLSFIVISVLFAIILKKLPDIKISWDIVFPGAFISASLFMLGEYLLGIYFGTAKPASAYGVAGSIILLMIWVSYSCSILLLGSEYSKALYIKYKSN